MKIIGITGGVGAGKSTVLSFLDTLPGVRTVQADCTGHLVMEPGTEAYDKIREHFGERITGADGRIDRQLMGSLVFSDKEELNWLNSVIHPAVKDFIRREIQLEEKKGECRFFFIEAALLIEDHYDEICDEFWYIYTEERLRRERLRQSMEEKKGECRFFFIEAALLIEDHYDEICDEFWYIYTEERLRRERLRQSRGYSDEKMDAILSSQKPDSVFRKYCQEVIDNGSDEEKTLLQVRRLLEERGYIF